MTPPNAVPQEHIISKKLDVIIRLLALGLIRNAKNQKEQITVLSDAGFQPKQIADILDTTANNVSVALCNARKERSIKEKQPAATCEVQSITSPTPSEDDSHGN